MMREYMSKTAEVDFLRKHMDTMEKEIRFWEERRSLSVEKDGTFSLEAGSLKHL